MSRHFEQLQRSIGYEFSDVVLLRRALSHRSWIAESDDEVSNERLEFLGDAVLGWVVADLVYSEFEDWDEGVLTDLAKVSSMHRHWLRSRETSISAPTFFSVTAKMQLADATRSRFFPTLLRPSSGGLHRRWFTQAFDVVRRLIAPRLAAAPSRLDRLDQKSTLQELLASLGRPSPSYTITLKGPTTTKNSQQRW